MGEVVRGERRKGVTSTSLSGGGLGNFDGLQLAPTFSLEFGARRRVGSRFKFRAVLNTLLIAHTGGVISITLQRERYMQSNKKKVKTALL